MPSRFEVDYNDPTLAFEPLVDEVFAELKSSFLEMPRGDGFIDYATFEQGYQTLKRTTDAFTLVSPATIEAAVAAAPISFIVFRTILGFTPPEWAYVTTEMTGITIDQGAARSIDRAIRLRPTTAKALGTSLTDKRIRAMIDAGVRILLAGATDRVEAVLHRLDKADTREGLKSLQPVADLGVRYPVLLSERFLGRRFECHRD